MFYAEKDGCESEEEEVILNNDLIRSTDMNGAVTKYSRIYSTVGDTLTVRDARGKDAVIASDIGGREIHRKDEDGEITTTVYDFRNGIAGVCYSAGWKTNMVLL